MPTTSIEGPHNNAAVGTGIGDGTNYTALGQPQRVHEGVGGSSAAFGTSANRGTRWYNCFNATQIPTGATINGIELVADGSSYIGNFGSTGASESTTFQMYIHNGTSYSAALAFLSTPSGGTLANNDTELTLTGPNKRYVNASAGADIMAGANNSLSGLSWDPSDQADFGFAITCIAVGASPVYGVIRGIGLRVTYTDAGYSHTVIGSSPAAVIGVASANVSKVIGV